MHPRKPLRIRAARWAGTTVRVLRPAARLLPGVAGAVLASVGVGELAGHVFGRGVAPWTACVVAAGFLLRFGAEINTLWIPPHSGDD